MVSDSSFRVLSHMWRVHGSQIKKDGQNLTLMTLNVEHCHWGSIWLMSLPSEHFKSIVTLVASLW